MPNFVAGNGHDIAHYIYVGETFDFPVVLSIKEGFLTYVNEESNSTTWPGLNTISSLFALSYFGSNSIFYSTEYVPPVIEETSTVLLPIYIYIAIVTALGILFALVCFVFNILFRNRRYERTMQIRWHEKSWCCFQGMTIHYVLAGLFFVVVLCNISYP